MNKEYTLIQDNSGCWLMVPYSDIIESGVESKISSDSYRSRECAYLEENSDMVTFLNAIKERGYDIKLVTEYTNKLTEYVKLPVVLFKFW